MEEEILEKVPITENLNEENLQEWEYTILDENDEEVIDPDLTLGYLKKEKITNHIEKIPAITHPWITAVYFKDNTVAYPKENDSHVVIDGSKIYYQFLPNENPKGIRGQTISYIVDVPEQPARDEIETIYRYIFYTEQELADREFIDTTPTRLDAIESDANDMLKVVAELAGSDIEERVGETQETLDDLLLAVADILGGADE